MNVTIVYDSVFGNTAAIAKAVADELSHAHQVRLLTVAEAKDAGVGTADLLIVGSPTRGFRPTPAMAEFVAGLPDAGGRRAAAFDTRIALETIHPAPLRWVVDAGGYAAQRLGNELERRGYAVDTTTGAFLVSGTEGPLQAGEVDRARAWAAALTG